MRLVGTSPLRSGDWAGMDQQLCWFHSAQRGDVKVGWEGSRGGEVSWGACKAVFLVWRRTLYTWVKASKRAQLQSGALLSGSCSSFPQRFVLGHCYVPNYIHSTLGPSGVCLVLGWDQCCTSDTANVEFGWCTVFAVAVLLVGGFSAAPAWGTKPGWWSWLPLQAF